MGAAKQRCCCAASNFQPFCTTVADIKPSAPLLLQRCMQQHCTVAALQTHLQQSIDNSATKRAEFAGAPAAVGTAAVSSGWHPASNLCASGQQLEKARREGAAAGSAGAGWPQARAGCTCVGQAALTQPQGKGGPQWETRREAFLQQPPAPARAVACCSALPTAGFGSLTHAHSAAWWA